MSIIDIIKEYTPDSIGTDKIHFIKLFGKDVLNEIIKPKIEKEEKEDVIRKLLFDEVSLRIRELLRADNFSVLTGAGASFDVGGVLFSKKEMEGDGWVAKTFTGENNKDYQLLLQLFINSAATSDNYSVEDFITFLVRLEFATSKGAKVFKKDDKEEKVNITENVSTVKLILLKELAKRCILPSIGNEDKTSSTKTFIKRILSRPVNLRRTNLFTTNYDLVFEKAMDELGVTYVDGFIGGLKQFFHPEAFNFDYYYPAATTEGKVSRLERVLHFYKLHGSLNWVTSDDKSFLNVFGIEKMSEEQIPEDGKEVLIYPTPMKESDTLGFPYSEVFRRFANTIQQPQSVLITYGYSFGDAHINRIIFEALSIPSFQLLIVSYSWSENIKMIYERFKQEPSVGFIIGEHFADWKTFVNNILPDLPSQDLEEKYQQKREKAISISHIINQKDIP